MNLKDLITADVAPIMRGAPEEPPAQTATEPAPQPAAPEVPVVAKTPAPPVVAINPRKAQPAKRAGEGTIRERAKQLSLYLEEPVYEQIREIAHVERVKMHQLILEGVDLLLRKKGAPSIKELMKKAG
jgi:hypothetical protein